MAEVVNLRMARKAQARRQAEQQAAANRAAHGLSKTERRAAELALKRIERTLDGARRDADD